MTQPRFMLSFFAGVTLLGVAVLVATRALLPEPEEGFSALPAITGTPHTDILDSFSMGLIYHGASAFFLYGLYVIVYSLVTRNLPQRGAPLSATERETLTRQVRRAQKTAKVGLWGTLIGVVLLGLCWVGMFLVLILIDGWDGLEAMILLLLGCGVIALGILLSAFTAGVATLHRHLRLDILAQDPSPSE